MTIEQALREGVAAHKEGKLLDAERLYRKILRSEPTHPDANHNLGVLAASVDKADVALPLFKTALETNPKIEQFWISYIGALIKQKQLGTAKKLLEKAKIHGVNRYRIDFLQSQFSLKPERTETVGVTPPQEQIKKLLAHYENKRFSEAERVAVYLTRKFPQHPFGWKVLGAARKK